MTTYYVRVNFDHYADPSAPVWVIKTDGADNTHANALDIQVPSSSVGLIEADVLRWYLKCDGNLAIEDGIAHITVEA